MKSNILFKCFSVLLLACLISCSKADRTIPDGNVNETIVLTTPDDCNIYQINTTICMAVVLQGKYPVLVRLDTVKAFEQNNGEWKSVNNGIDNSEYKFVLYPSDNFLLKAGAIFAQPMFKDTSVPITLRYVVTGNLYQNEKIGEKVSAFIDVTLNP